MSARRQDSGSTLKSYVSMTLKEELNNSKMKSERKMLRNFIKELILLESEIVTVTRNKKQFSYSADFDEYGDIVSAKKVQMRPKIAEAIESVTTIMAVPQSTVYEKLLTLPDDKIQAKASDIRSVADEMKSNWEDTLDWPSVNRVGKGELQLKLAFKANSKIKEPDFVSEDGKIKISVKSFGNGSELVRTGEKNPKVPQLCKEVADCLKFYVTNQKFPQGSWSGADLANALRFLEEDDRKNAIEEMRTILDLMRIEVLHEHDADGILALDARGGFYPITNPEDIHITTIRNSGTRLEFAGPNLSTKTMTFHRALERAAMGKFDPRILKSDIP